MINKKFIPDINKTNILPTVIVVGASYFLLVKPILEKFGVLKSASEKENLAAITEQQAYNPDYHKQKGGVTITRAFAETGAQKIKNAFNIMYDDFNTIIGVFKSLKNKSDVSYLADVFLNKYGYDMYSYMADPNGIFPWDGLSTVHLTQINDLVKKLPA